MSEKDFLNEIEILSTGNSERTLVLEQLRNENASDFVILCLRTLNLDSISSYICNFCLIQIYSVLQQMRRLSKEDCILFLKNLPIEDKDLMKNTILKYFTNSNIDNIIADLYALLYVLNKPDKNFSHKDFFLPLYNLLQGCQYTNSVFSFFSNLLDYNKDIKFRINKELSDEYVDRVIPLCQQVLSEDFSDQMKAICIKIYTKILSLRLLFRYDSKNSIINNMMSNLNLALNMASYLNIGYDFAKILIISLEDDNHMDHINCILAFVIEYLNNSVRSTHGLFFLSDLFKGLRENKYQHIKRSLENFLGDIYSRVVPLLSECDLSMEFGGTDDVSKQLAAYKCLKNMTSSYSGTQFIERIAKDSVQLLSSDDVASKIAGLLMYNIYIKYEPKDSLYNSFIVDVINSQYLRIRQTGFMILKSSIKEPDKYIKNREKFQELVKILFESFISIDCENTRCCALRTLSKLFSYFNNSLYINHLKDNFVMIVENLLLIIRSDSIMQSNNIRNFTCKALIEAILGCHIDASLSFKVISDLFMIIETYTESIPDLSCDLLFSVANLVGEPPYLSEEDIEQIFASIKIFIRCESINHGAIFTFILIYSKYKTRSHMDFAIQIIENCVSKLSSNLTNNNMDPEHVKIYYRTLSEAFNIKEIPDEVFTNIAETLLDVLTLSLNLDLWDNIGLTISTIGSVILRLPKFPIQDKMLNEWIKVINRINEIPDLQTKEDYNTYNILLGYMFDFSASIFYKYQNSEEFLQGKSLHILLFKPYVSLNNPKYVSNLILRKSFKFLDIIKTCNVRLIRRINSYINSTKYKDVLEYFSHKYKNDQYIQGSIKRHREFIESC